MPPRSTAGRAAAPELALERGPPSAYDAARVGAGGGGGANCRVSTRVSVKTRAPESAACSRRSWSNSERTTFHALLDAPSATKSVSGLQRELGMWWEEGQAYSLRAYIG